MKKGQKYTIVVALYGPVMRDGKVVLSQLIAKIKTFELVVGASVESRQKLAQGLIPIGYHKSDIWYCNVKDDKGRVQEHNGHYTGVATLPSGDPEYIELLIGRGWKFTEEFLAPYNFEVSTP